MDKRVSEPWISHNITRNSTLLTASLAKTGGGYGLPRQFLLCRGLLQHRLGNDDFAVICIRWNYVTPSAEYPVQSLFRRKWITSCDACAFIRRHQTVKSGNLKHKYMHNRIAYYSTSTATRQILLLSGDVELNPGWQGNVHLQESQHRRSGNFCSLISHATDDSSDQLCNHRPIPVRITTLQRVQSTMTLRPNRNNLVIVPRAPLVPEFKPCKAVEFCLLNARSIKNKATILNDFVIENKIDIMAFTETWLLAGDTDGAVISDVTPAGYVFRHVSRERRGGGVAVLCKKSLNVKINLMNRYKSFEYIDTMLHSNSKTL